MNAEEVRKFCSRVTWSSGEQHIRAGFAGDDYIDGPYTLRATLAVKDIHTDRDITVTSQLRIKALPSSEDELLRLLLRTYVTGVLHEVMEHVLVDKRFAIQPHPGSYITDTEWMAGELLRLVGFIDKNEVVRAGATIYKHDPGPKAQPKQDFYDRDGDPRERQNPLLVPTIDQKIAACRRDLQIQAAFNEINAKNYPRKKPQTDKSLRCIATYQTPGRGA